MIYIDICSIVFVIKISAVIGVDLFFPSPGEFRSKWQYFVLNFEYSQFVFAQKRHGNNVTVVSDTRMEMKEFRTSVGRR